MKTELDKVMTAAGQVADKASRQAVAAVQNGHCKVEIFRLKRRLAKAQKQLGALVYMLHKTGQESEPMVLHYVEEIDALKAQIELHEAQNEAEKTMLRCALCGAVGMEGLLFCRRCGAKIPK